MSLHVSYMPGYYGSDNASTQRVDYVINTCWYWVGIYDQNGEKTSEHLKYIYTSELGSSSSV